MRYAIQQSLIFANTEEEKYKVKNAFLTDILLLDTSFSLLFIYDDE